MTSDSRQGNQQLGGGNEQRAMLDADTPALEQRPGTPASAPAAAGSRIDLVLRINGKDRRLSLDPRTTLLDTLREHLYLTGTKRGCAIGQCGACTVHMDGKRMKSCLWLAALAEGHEITTIEGLADGEELHPLQAAFIEHDAFQCGYCTSGQIMAGAACIAEGHAGSAQEIRDWMSGNLCRCGAYNHIVAAIQDAAGTAAKP
jgi:xanthine dehydrogenase YagT iron-sulfur-binding subunit